MTIAILKASQLPSVRCSSRADARHIDGLTKGGILQLVRRSHIPALFCSLAFRHRLTCAVAYYMVTPQIRPRYVVSFDPNACYGPAPFAPVHYSRWLAASPGTLYAVR